jgi:hypothetical protein
VHQHGGDLLSWPGIGYIAATFEYCGVDRRKAKSIFCCMMLQKSHR